MSDVRKEKELAERRKNDPALNHTQDHLVRKLFSKFKRGGPQGGSSFDKASSKDLEKGHSVTDNGAPAGGQYNFNYRNGKAVHSEISLSKEKQQRDFNYRKPSVGAGAGGGGGGGNVGTGGGKCDKTYVSSMIPSARSTFSPVAITMLSWKLFCFAPFWTDTTCENSDHYWP